MDLRTVFPIPAVTLAMTLAMNIALAQDEPRQQGEATTTVAATPTDEQKGADRAERAKANSWWNVDTVQEALKLSDEQRQQMDDLRSEAQKQREADGEKRRQLEEQMEAAFLAADLDAAGKLSAELQKQTGPGDNALKLETLALLSKEQLAALKEQYPRVLSDSWRRNTRRLVEEKKSGEGREGREGGKRGGRRGKAEKSAEAESGGEAAGKDD